MANIFSITGRLTGKILNKPSVSRTVHSVTQYISSEFQLSQIRLCLEMLRNKRKRHFTILGRTIYRLLTNNVPPFENDQVNTAITVLREIDLEIDAVEQELEQKKTMFEEQRKKARDRS